MTGTLEAMLVSCTRLAPSSRLDYPMSPRRFAADCKVFSARRPEVPIHFEILSVLAIVVLTMTATVALGIFGRASSYGSQGDPVTAAIAGLSYVFGHLVPKEILPSLSSRRRTCPDDAHARGHSPAPSGAFRRARADPPPRPFLAAGIPPRRSGFARSIAARTADLAAY